MIEGRFFYKEFYFLRGASFHCLEKWTSKTVRSGFGASLANIRSICTYSLGHDKEFHFKIVLLAPNDFDAENVTGQSYRIMLCYHVFPLVWIYWEGVIFWRNRYLAHQTVGVLHYYLDQKLSNCWTGELIQFPDLHVHQIWLPWQLFRIIFEKLYVPEGPYEDSRTRKRLGRAFKPLLKHIEHVYPKKVYFWI